MIKSYNVFFYFVISVSKFRFFDFDGLVARSGIHLERRVLSFVTSFFTFHLVTFRKFSSNWGPHLVGQELAYHFAL